MNNKTEMTMDDLREVLLENEVTNFDPVAEAFKVPQDIIYILYIHDCGCVEEVRLIILILLVHLFSRPASKVRE